MPFELTATEERVRKIAREFSDKKITPLRAQLKKETEFDSAHIRRQIWDDQRSLGFHLTIVPREEGGSGIGFIGFSIASEEICAAWPDVNYFIYSDMAYYFVRGADEQVRKKWFDGIIKGDVAGAVGITEQSGGSDPLGMSTTARKDGDSWIINGRKCFIDDAEDCDFVMILAKTGDPQSAETPGGRALSAFIIEREMPGFRVSRLEDTIARKADLAEIVMDDIRVPERYLLGGVGRGMAVAFRAVGDVGRLSAASMSNGYNLGSYRSAVKYANERMLFGKPIATLQAIQSRVADMFIDLEATRALTYRAAWLTSKGLRCEAEQCSAKFFAAQAAVRSSLNAINIHGAYGVLSDYMPQVFYRAAAQRISAGGAEEALKAMISAAALKEANPEMGRKNAEQAE